jgi:pyruvate/2-oxoglutarate dehydrogenase complex dihydrolipoamide acyltransferase (E2) component
MILAVLMAAALAATAEPGENLLRNPGFESVLIDRPDAWDVFVLPQEGAFARTAREAHSGDLAVLLHTALPYDKDPANNWSQNVEGDLAGTTLHAGAWIRTEEAGGAALWVQCWQRSPLKLLLTASTAQRDPVRGTQDWREISMPVEVPKGTAFITFRCVLIGTGSAWFDDAYLQSQAGAAATSDPAPKPAQVAPVPAAAPVPARPAELPDETVAILDQMEQDLAALRDANLLLGEALDQVRAENRHLLEELNAVRAGLVGLESQRATLTPAEPQPAPAAPAASGKNDSPDPPLTPKARRVPILVPHGVDWSSTP